MPKKFFRISEAAAIVGVSTSTLRKYSNEGRVSFTRNLGGQRLYTVDQLSVLNPNLLVPTDRVDERAAFYVRASDGSNVLLDSQEKILRANAPIPVVVVKDKASGLSENRKGLERLLNLAERGDITDVYVTQKDRLTRFGFSYLERLFNTYGVKVHVLNSAESKTVTEELMEDFMSLLTSFSGRYYRLRGHDAKRKFLSDASKQAQE